MTSMEVLAFVFVDMVTICGDFGILWDSTYFGIVLQIVPYQREKLMNTLTLIMGTPNAGKTTYSQRFDSPIHFDDYQLKREKGKSIYDICNEEVAKRDGDVCVEGVYNRINQRLTLLDAVKEKNLYKVCIWLDVPTDKCIQRERAYRKRPEIIVKHQANRLEPPTFDEGWDEIRHVVWTSKWRDENETNNFGKE